MPPRHAASHPAGAASAASSSAADRALALLRQLWVSRSAKFLVGVLILFSVLLVLSSDSSAAVVVATGPTSLLTPGTHAGHSIGTSAASAGALAGEALSTSPPQIKKATVEGSVAEPKAATTAATPAVTNKDSDNNNNTNPADTIKQQNSAATASASSSSSDTTAANGVSRGGTGAPSLPPLLTSGTGAARVAAAPYTRFVHRLIVEELGIEAATALYDPLFFDNAATFIDLPTGDSDGDAVSGPHIDPHSLFLVEKGLPWAFRTVLMAPTVPAPLTTMATKLVMLKQTVSMGLARLARDARLAEEWAASSSSSVQVGGANNDTDTTMGKQRQQQQFLFSRPIRAAIAGYASYAVSFLQVLIDGERRMADLSGWAKARNNAHSRAVAEAWASAAKEGGAEGSEIPPYADVPDPIIHPHLDPLINIMQLIAVGPTAASSAASSASDKEEVQPPGDDRAAPEGEGGEGPKAAERLDDDPSVAAILAHAGRMRSAADGVLSKALLGDAATPQSSVAAALAATTALSSSSSPSRDPAFAAAAAASQDALVSYLGAHTNPQPVVAGILKAYASAKAKTKASAAGGASTAAVLGGVLGYATLVWDNRIAALDAMADAPQQENNLGEQQSQRPAALANRGQYALQYFSNSDYGRWNKYLVNGRFWNSIRPVVGCTALMKLCEEPDGCRHLCNLNYLLLAQPQPPAQSSEPSAARNGNDGDSHGAPSPPAPKAGKKAHQHVMQQYAHQAIGFGSNNEYDWELGLVDAFKRAAPAGPAGVLLSVQQQQQQQKSGSSSASPLPFFSFPNTIGRITVFDCTLKQWTPPAFLTEGAVGFGHASYCLGLADSSPLPAVRAANGGSADGVAVVGFPSLRKFINSDGRFPNNYRDATNNNDKANNDDGDGQRPPNPFLKRFPARSLIARNPNADKIIRHRQSGSAASAEDADDVIVPSPLFVDYTTFDEVSVLKLDVEGFEHIAFPSFLRAELQDLGLHYATGGDGAGAGPAASPLRELRLIRFDTDAPDSPTISQLGMEFHRGGHKGPAGASYWGALRSHYSLMQLYGKGFLMFAQEKNPVDYCCYEIALAHYRHFVRSEVWLSARG